MKKRRRLKWILIILTAVILIAVLLGLSNSSETEVKVAIEKVTKRTIIETVNASGKVYPEVEVKVSPDISGEITELTVQEGDSVRKGQMLARIYMDRYASERGLAAASVTQSQASVANTAAATQALKAQLEQDRLTYNRNKELYNDKVISKAEFEQYEVKMRTSEAQYNAALQNIRGLQAGVQGNRTQLSIANKNLSRATIVAPMDGAVSMLNVKKGERVVGTAQNLGTEMLRVADMKVMEVRVDVGENDVVKVTIGDSADVMIDAYNNRKFKGVVTQIASSTKSSTGAMGATDVTNYEVHIRLDPSSYADLHDPLKPRKFPFRPGMNATADIKTRRVDNAIAVPITSVASRVRGSEQNLDDKKKEKTKDEEENGEEIITVGAADELEEVAFVLKKDGTVEKRVVKTGIQDINYFEILSGLQLGEEVVAAPYNAISKSLKSGKKVTVVSKEKLFENK